MPNFSKPRSAPSKRLTLMRASIAWLTMIALSGCATTDVQFKFVDAATRAPLSDVTGEWLTIGGGSPFSHAIPTKARTLIPVGKDGTLAASHLREESQNHFSFIRRGYGWTIGTFSAGALRTSDGEVLRATNGVITVPMKRDEPTR